MSAEKLIPYVANLLMSGICLYVLCMVALRLYNDRL